MAYFYDKDGNVMEREHRRNECMAFMKNVRFLAKENNISYGELAEMLGKNENLLGKYLKGDVIPREGSFDDMVVRASDLFDISGVNLKNRNFIDNYETEPVVETKEISTTNDEEGNTNIVIDRIVSRINEKRAMIMQLDQEIKALESALDVVKEFL